MATNAKVLALTVIANALDDIAPRFDTTREFKTEGERRQALRQYHKSLTKRRKDFRRRQDKYAAQLVEIKTWREGRLAADEQPGGRRRLPLSAGARERIEKKYGQEVSRIARNIDLFDTVGNAIHWFANDGDQVRRWCALGGLDVESVMRAYRERLRLLNVDESELTEGKLAAEQVESAA